MAKNVGSRDSNHFVLLVQNILSGFQCVVRAHAKAGTTEGLNAADFNAAACFEGSRGYLLEPSLRNYY